MDDWGSNELKRDKDLFLHQLTVKDSTNKVIVKYDAEQIHQVLGEQNCGGYHYDDQIQGGYNLYCSNSINIPLNITTSGDYLIEISAYRVIWDSNNYILVSEDEANDYGDFRMNVALLVSDFLTQNSTGNELIKQTIISLVEKSWGEFLTTDDDEIEIIYQIFLESWQAKKLNNNWNHIQEENSQCDFPYHEYNRPEDNFDGWQIGNDPESIMSAWRTVILYLMSDYRYLHE
jgi:hypothetical protein